MTATKNDLDQAYTRLSTALSLLDAQHPDARARAKDVRVNLTRHMNLICDDLDGKTAKCEIHPTEKAHNCGSCRSERIARPGYDGPGDLPPNPIAEIEERKLGESEPDDLPAA